ncbi:MAG TPA: DNA mismatch repair endonuclease MutL [Candidatus Nitrosocosmicus sp.]|nr:DNA mismatch repair endonuclease MutL [Candidatus Nitrosocosmicus sp.]
MSQIKKLSSEIIAKIAAGEVIERPAYAVKELIENAIDAKANKIRIDIERSGLQKISISDDGIGMSREDISLAFQRHTTSKISTEEDLYNIASFGFRGEALSSIAAISTTSIQSREKSNNAGTIVNLKRNEVDSIRPIGMAPGTQIIVEDLFHNVPARQKFLKSLQTEFRYIIEIVNQYALSYPNIAFVLTHNKKLLINVLGNQSLEDRISVLLGQRIRDHLFAIQYKDSYISIQGYLSKPILSSHNSFKNYLFVNNRPIKNKLIYQIIKRSYGTLLAPDKFPFFILFLTIPKEFIDVNVHPRKEDLAFHNNENLQEALTNAVKETLAENNLTLYDARWNKKQITYDQTKQQLLVRESNTNSYGADALKKNVLSQDTMHMRVIKKNSDILQIHNLYLALQTERGFLFIDQHAAHERILYEKFIKEFSSSIKNKKLYTLTKPIELDLSIEDNETLHESLSVFKNIGFYIKVQKRKAIITKIPQIFKDRNIEEIIIEMLDDIKQDLQVKNIDSASNRMITFLSCRNAIKAGDSITKENAKKLLQELLQTDNPYTCPHGRPTQYEITMNELAKIFHRK